MKILVISSFPAPYRVDVFKEINKVYELDVFFETAKDQNRDAEWFAKKDDFVFNVLDNELSISKYHESLKNIKSYDAVLAYDFYLKYAIKAQTKCILHNVPYFVNCDGAFINKNIIKRVVKSFFISNAYGCFASGEFAKKYFMYYGAREDKIYKHNFTSLHREDILDKPLDATAKATIRGELGIENRKTAITVGQFIYRKGFDILLEAWKEINSDCQLIIIGGGELENTYKEYIKANNFRNVKVIGFQSKKQLLKYYKASDVFILPTREDIWGLVVNEAMACGLSIITTDRCIAGLELIEDGINGYIVPVGNVFVLRNRILDVVKNDEICNRMATNNIKKIQGNTIEGIAQKHIDVINKLLSF